MCFRLDIVPTREYLDIGEFGVDELLKCLDVYATDSIPFTILLYDDHAGIVGHDHVGMPVVLAETDAPRAYQWLEGLYEDCKADISPIDPENL